MSDITKVIENVKKWELRRGKKELLQHLEGGKDLTYKQAVLAKCYDCGCGWSDGAADCNVPTCPLYGFMPYRDNKPVRTTGRTMSDEHKQKMKDAAKAKKEQDAATLP